MLVRGFSLIEVLVSLLILGLGLLGIVALSAHGQRAYVESTQRSEATRYVEEMADRIRANTQVAQDPTFIRFYVDPAGSATPDLLGDGSEFDDVLGAAPTGVNCNTSVCTPQQLALFDRAWWDGLLSGQVSDLGLIGAVGCITQVPGVLPRARVSLAWQGMRDTLDSGGANGPLAAITCGDVAFAGDLSSRRLVSLEVAL